ncbi:MAG: hypothetical protein MUO42_03270 [Anaerolineaceae bacterium]|jgi:hypothetical protein|nr:hypothetical protein [Anaerolineaceae bacterium]
MDNQEADITIKEILEEDNVEVKKKKRGSGCFLRLLIIMTLLFICVYGFILFRQKLLEIEAQAIVSARQTVTANIAAPGVEADVTEAQPAESASPIGTVTPLPDTATPDPMLERTATVAAQLTSVAEFQLTVTQVP